MFIAKEKKKTNIAEYILYMWQVEDLIRAFAFDSKSLCDKLFINEDLDAKVKDQLYYWYENLAEMMKLEHVKDKGHVQVVQNIVDELTEIHFNLLYKSKDPKYGQLLFDSANNLVEFRKKSNISNDISDVELALNALYGILILKLKHKEIGKQTLKAIEGFSKILSYLSLKYKELENQDLQDL